MYATLTNNWALKFHLTQWQTEHTLMISFAVSTSLSCFPATLSLPALPASLFSLILQWTHDTQSQLRVFTLVVLTSWNVLPLNIHIIFSFTACKSPIRMACPNHSLPHYQSLSPHPWSISLHMFHTCLFLFTALTMNYVPWWERFRPCS